MDGENHEDRQWRLDQVREAAADFNSKFYKVILRAEILGPNQGDDSLRADQAAHMGGQDPRITVFHRSLPDS